MIPAKQHLHDSNMTYLQHLAHSFKQSTRLLLIAFQSYIHGILPWFFANRGPVGVYKIFKEIRQQRHIKKLLDGQR